MIDKVKTIECAICEACSNICPRNAISFKNEVDGFYYPDVDLIKCVKCGLCEKVCPAINPLNTLKRDGFPVGYAAQSIDTEIRKKSTSGAVFYELGKYIVENGGYVCGAVFTKNYEVRHILTDSLSDLKTMRGSKYVQSKIGNIYIQIRELLKSGKTVLFCGCPCQVAALRRVVGREMSNLYTVDFVCHGIPSQSMFDSYRESLERRYSGSVTNFEFRNKKSGWHNSAVQVKFNNGKVYSEPYTVDPYTKSFMSGTTMKSACYTCGFKEFKSGSDIMLGDFWGSELILADWDDNTGISATIVNTNKGQALLEKVKLHKKRAQLGEIIRYNRNIVYATEANKNRSLFFNYAKTFGYGRAMIHFYGESAYEKTKRKTKQVVRKLFYFILGRGKPFY